MEENRFEIDFFQHSTLPTGDAAYYNGHYYSDKAIGSSMIGVLVYYLLLGVDYWLHTSPSIFAFKQLLTFFVISVFLRSLPPWSIYSQNKSAKIAGIL